MEQYQCRSFVILIVDDYFFAKLLLCFNIVVIVILSQCRLRKNKCKLKLYSLHIYCHFGVFYRQHTSVSQYTTIQDGCQHKFMSMMCLRISEGYI